MEERLRKFIDGLQALVDQDDSDDVLVAFAEEVIEGLRSEVLQDKLTADESS